MPKMFSILATSVVRRVNHSTDMCWNVSGVSLFSQHLSARFPCAWPWPLPLLYHDYFPCANYFLLHALPAMLVISLLVLIFLAFFLGFLSELCAEQLFLDTVSFAVLVLVPSKWSTYMLKSYVVSISPSSIWFRGHIHIPTCSLAILRTKL